VSFLTRHSIHRPVALEQAINNACKSSAFLAPLSRHVLSVKDTTRIYLSASQLPQHSNLIGHHLVDEDPIVDEEEIDTNLNNIDNGDEEFKRISKTYRSVELKKWRPAPLVRENPGKPGEMGKPVKMKSHQQEEMKEKFKENQFNLLASDMILLNRSLSDVRHKE
jgi:hypothetical protein